MNKKIVRPRRGYWELATLWRLLDEDYCHTRAQIKWDEKQIIASGHPDSHAYPMREQKDHLHRLSRFRRPGKLVKSLKEG